MKKNISIGLVFPITALLAVALLSCSSHLSSQKNKPQWTEESIRKYLDDNKGKLDPIEGIYSISSDNSDRMLFKVVPLGKKSNDFARVAIMKNTEGFSPQFIELLLEGVDRPKFSRTAEYTRIQTSSTYLSKQFAQDGRFTTYSFAYDEAAGSMEGNRKSDGKMKLLYLKLYPVK